MRKKYSRPREVAVGLIAGNMMICAIDPSTTASGVCVLENGNIIFLQSLSAGKLIAFCLDMCEKDVTFIVENSNLISSNWHGSSARGNVGKNKGVSMFIAGFLKHNSLKVVELKPDGYSQVYASAAIFKADTRWAQMTNKDTRAAYAMAKRYYNQGKFKLN